MTSEVMVTVRRKRCVWPVVSCAMSMQAVTILDLSVMSGIEYKSLCRKLNGSAKLSFKEGVAIYEALQKPAPLDVLFSESNEFSVRIEIPRGGDQR